MKSTERLLKAAGRIASDSVFFPTQEEKELAYVAMVAAIKWSDKIDKESQQKEKTHEERMKEIENLLSC